MKPLKTILIIFLNILFCSVLLWFFSLNAILRPYLGSITKEFLSGLMLLVTVYANYFLLYPKLYQGHSALYWILVVGICFLTAGVELASGYSFISNINAEHIQLDGGPFHFFSEHLLFIFGRNLAFNFFPFALRERHLLKQSLDSEISAVYQYARMIDVCDKNNNCQFISIDDIFYCCKNGNETEIYTEDGTKHTRYCTIKYLTQLFEDKDFIRISPSIIVPVKHIASCDGKEVVLKMMPWTETPLTFRLDTQKFPHVVDLIEEHLPADQVSIIFKQQVDENEDAKNISSVPPKEKLDAVYDYIKEFPGCRSTVLIAHTSYSKTTMERIISELRKQGLVEFRGSKKKGGYYVVEGRDDR